MLVPRQKRWEHVRLKAAMAIEILEFDQKTES